MAEQQIIYGINPLKITRDTNIKQIDPPIVDKKKQKEALKELIKLDENANLYENNNEVKKIENKNERKGEGV